MRVALVTRPNPDASGAVPIYIRIAHAGHDRYVAVGLRILPKEWDRSKGRVRRSHDDHEDLNAKLDRHLSRATRVAADLLLAEGRETTADALKAAVSAVLHPTARPAGTGLVAYGRTLQAAKRKAGKIGTSLVYGTALRHAAATCGEAGDIALSAVTPAWLRGHEERLASLGHARNYIAKQLSTLRAIMRRAAAENVPGGEAAARAFSSVQIRHERVERRRLPLSDVRKLEALRPSLSGRRADALDWFLLSFYLGGARFGDIIALKWTDVEWSRGTGERKPVYIRWRQSKTGDAQGVPVVAGAAAVLARWDARTGPSSERPSPLVFDALAPSVLADPEALFRAKHTMSALARKGLRAISEQADVLYVGFHGSRHSVADALRQQGVPVATISQVLGHASIAITQSYLAGFDRDAVGDALRGLE